MVKFLYYLIKTARPRQWLKNLAVFASIIFTGQLFNPESFFTTFITFLVFCTASSANYLLNDVLDASKDRKHPFKRNRPVASGAISPREALVATAVLIFVSLFLANSLNPSVLTVSFLFLILEFSYSLLFKHVAVVDILAITAAYILRVYAGEVATGFQISIWLFLTVLSLSLFLATGKRRAELTLIEGYKEVVPQDTRISLSHYSERLLDAYIAMAAASTWISYAFYTFLEKSPSRINLQNQWVRFLFQIPERKWLMLTIPFVLFGIMRYMQLIYEKHEGESPEMVLTSDPPLMLTILGWGLIVVFVIYGLWG